MKKVTYIIYNIYIYIFSCSLYKCIYWCKFHSCYSIRLLALRGKENVSIFQATDFYKPCQETHWLRVLHYNIASVICCVVHFGEISSLHFTGITDSLKKTQHSVSEWVVKIYPKVFIIVQATHFTTKQHRSTPSVTLSLLLIFNVFVCGSITL